ncbi:MAG TPA: FliM/FliN family flagellar motor C-terminal domain-containing protein [Candidatus Elarobacter sp.]|jgi:flagellar motor switch/type III secretory pathway protein FliN
MTVRPLRFSRRTSIPLAAACVVANGLRETLRELLGAGCELAIGEPAAIPRDAWTILAADALLFLARGRPTDVVLVLPHADARRLVLRAFGETADGRTAPGYSTLEQHALARIAERCAAAFDPLCAERGGAVQPVSATQIPACVGYFDVRVSAPIALTLGVGIVRDLPAPAPAARLTSAHLADVGLEVHAEFAEGTIDAAAFFALAPGTLVRLDTKVGGPASLKVAGNRVASGIPGVVASRNAIRLHDVTGGNLL